MDKVISKWCFALLVPQKVLSWMQNHKVKTEWQHSEECMCRLGNIAMRDYQESVITGQMDRQIDRRWTKWSLCAAMLRRQHKKETSMLGANWQTDIRAVI